MSFHHRKLPESPAAFTILSGHTPPDEVGFRSERLQILYNHTDVAWSDSGSHKHTEGDECFIVPKRSLEVEVAGVRHTIGEREFCCFPAGVYHAVVGVKPPVETLMIRAPSVNDKVYQTERRN